MYQKIIFTPMTELAQNYTQKPVPASTMIPDWYKNTKLYVNNENSYRILKTEKDSTAVNTTLKGCTPFLDAMTLGYIIVLSSDIEVSKVNNVTNIRWRTENDIVTGHKYEQTYSLPRNYGEQKEVLKWIFDWHIKTPKGYSCLYTHPHHRNDLPFRTFSGVVDTDTFPDSVHFPFQIFDFQKDFIIPKGTPICQIFPFKRDNWESEEQDVVPNMKQRAVSQVMSKIVRSYKTQFWNRKEFK